MTPTSSTTGLMPAGTNEAEHKRYVRAIVTEIHAYAAEHNVRWTKREIRRNVHVLLGRGRDALVELMGQVDSASVTSRGVHPHLRRMTGTYRDDTATEAIDNLTKRVS